MDGNRFDALTRSVGNTATRRGALGGLTAGGILAALGLGPQRTSAQDDSQSQDDNQGQGQNENQGVTCVIDFAATVRQGPSTGQPAGNLKGELTFTVTGKGVVQNASLKQADGSTLPVVGQATGHSLDLRIGSGANQTVVAMGVGEREISECSGAIDGLATGPAVGDLGDWHATAIRSSGSAGGGGNRNRDNAVGDAAGSGGGRGQGGGRGGQGGQASQGGQDGQGGQGGQGGGRGGGRNQGQGQGPGQNQGQGGAQASPTPDTQSGQCTGGQTLCNGACVDLMTDAANCGACGSVCESGLVATRCRNGVCERATCAVGEEFCGAVDGCRDLMTDPDHCGACGNACGDAFCVSGACEVVPPEGGPCDAGLIVCNGACVNVMDDRNACGNCATVCLPDEVCVSGVCTLLSAPCPNPGDINCNGICVNGTADPANCGGCGLACAAGEQCVGGACQAPQAPPVDCTAQGLADCGGVCIDTLNDPANCGVCGGACLAGESCSGGACIAGAAGAPVDCTAQGLVDCGGVCVDLLTDFGNCGGCGLICPAGNECVGGACQAPVVAAICAAGLIECTPGSCTDPMTDLVNCGGCGIVCVNQCLGGVCS